MKTTRFLILALGAVLALAMPVVASATPVPAPMSSVGTSIPAESADQQARDRLNELGTTQTQAQIREILDSGQSAEVLYDVDSAKYLAAYATGPAIPEFSLNPFIAPAE